MRQLLPPPILPLVLVLATCAAGQVTPKAKPDTARTRSIVLFERRSFDLRTFREAIRHRASPARVEAVLRGLRRAVLRD